MIREVAPAGFTTNEVKPRKLKISGLASPGLFSVCRRETTELLGPLALVAEPGDDAALLAHVRALWGGLASAPSRPVPVPTRAEVAALCAEDLLRFL